MINGDKDAVVPNEDVVKLVERLKTQRGIVIDHQVISGANHFFEGAMEEMVEAVQTYLDRRLKEDQAA
jgi:hypothetical protein